MKIFFLGPEEVIPKIVKRKYLKHGTNQRQTQMELRPKLRPRPLQLPPLPRRPEASIFPVTMEIRQFTTHMDTRMSTL